MASVTDKIKEERKKKEQGNDNRTNMEETESVRTNTPVGEPSQHELGAATSQREMTQEILEKWDSGSEIRSHNDRAVMTGKLCRRVMVLIKWQCGMDKAVDAHMVRVLEGWLRNRGISIYIDLL
jgi:hypothetical protein